MSCIIWLAIGSVMLFASSAGANSEGIVYFQSPNVGFGRPHVWRLVSADVAAKRPAAAMRRSSPIHCHGPAKTTVAAEPAAVVLGAGEVAVPPAVVPIAAKSVAELAPFEITPTLADETETIDSAAIGTSKLTTKLHKDVENDVSAEDARMNEGNEDADIVGDSDDDDSDDGGDDIFASDMPAFGDKLKQPSPMPVFFPMNLGKMFGKMAGAGNGGGVGAIAIANSHSVDGTVFSHAAAHGGSSTTQQRRRATAEKLRA